MSMRRISALAAAIGLLIGWAGVVAAQSRSSIEPGIPVPSRESLGRSETSGSLNPGLRDDPNSPIGPALGTAGAGPDGSLNPSSGTMANPSQ